MHATTVAVDLAKDVFELAFADGQGRVIERKRLTRRAFARAFEQRPPLRIVMEACGSAHHWARRFVRQGHAVRLLPASDVRPYVRGNKTDRNDASGILEADRCGGIASVREQSIPGHEALVAQMELDGKSTGADAAKAIVAAEKELRAQNLSKFEQDTNPPAPQHDEQQDGGTGNKAMKRAAFNRLSDKERREALAAGVIITG